MTPRLIVEQKITAFANRYAVYQAQPDGSKGPMTAFAQQKRFAFKEKVVFYTDETKQNIAFTFRAEKVLDVHGRYMVEDANGALLGSFKKAFAKSLLNSTWHISDADGQSTMEVRESNMALALARRFIGLIPIIGDIFEIIVMLLKYHFVFTDSKSGAVVGRYQKTTLFRDHYALAVSDEAAARQDPRVLAAMAVALDALQSR
jgi:uncharacterized protein YxjI